MTSGEAATPPGRHRNALDDLAERERQWIAATVRELSATLGGDAVTLAVHDERVGLLVNIAAFDPTPGAAGFIARLQRSRLRVDRAASGPAALTGDVVVLPSLASPLGPTGDVYRDEYFARFPVHALIAAPITVGDRVVGVINAARHDAERPFTPADVDTVTRVAAAIVHRITTASSATGEQVRPAAPEPASPRRAERRFRARDALALLPPAIAGAFALADDPWALRPGFALIVAVILVAYVGGVAPGAASVAGAAVVFWLVLAPSADTRGWNWFERTLPVVLFAAAGAGVVAAIGRLQRASAAERRLRGEREALIEHAPIAVASFDPDLRFTGLNRRMAEINGRPAAAHLGKTPRELAPDARSAYQDLLAEVRDRRRPLLDRHVAVRWTAGGERHFVASYFPVLDGDGEVVSIGATVEEVTRRVVEQQRVVELRALAEDFAAARRAGDVADAVLPLLAHSIGGRPFLAVATGEGLDVLVGGASAPAGRTESVALDADDPIARAWRDGEWVTFDRRPQLADAPDAPDARDAPDAHGAFGVAVPLAGKDGGDSSPPGVVGVTWDQPHTPGDDEHDMLAVVASMTSIALTRIRDAERLERARVAIAVDALQRAALPEELPRASWMELGATYVASSSVAPVGGDWYDAFERADGKLALVIADVAGHGPSAAGVMVKLRNRLRALATGADDPGAALTALNAIPIEEPTFASCLYALVDPATSTMRWSNAGHPPPLLVTAGTSRYLTAVHGPPIGAVPDTVYASGDVELASCGLLVLYTDGLVERRTESIDVGFDRLVAAVGDAGRASPDELCASLARDLRAGEQGDDACIVVLRWCGTGG